jgi:hypothetical protein
VAWTDRSAQDLTNQPSLDHADRRTRVLFFQLSTWLLATIIAVILVGATSIGLLVGRAVRDKSDLREPFSVMQGALLGFMGLVLAFGLSLAVGRYEARRAAVVDESNAIGTTYLRAQTLAEPQRTQSLALLKRFADTSIQLSRTVPGSAHQNRVRFASGRIQRQLWALAGESLNKNPTDSAPRLYVDSLNEMFDSQSSRIYSLGNRVPTPVLVLEIAGAAIALAILALHLGALGGRGVFTVMIAAGLVVVILLVTFDLDRPTRGLIRVPVGPLISVRAGMVPPPAAPAPSR